jgi:hypothetical protein
LANARARKCTRCARREPVRSPQRTTSFRIYHPRAQKSFCVELFRSF